MHNWRDVFPQGVSSILFCFLSSASSSAALHSLLLADRATRCVSLCVCRMPILWTLYFLFSIDEWGWGIALRQKPFCFLILYTYTTFSFLSFLFLCLDGEWMIRYWVPTSDLPFSSFPTSHTLLPYPLTFFLFLKRRVVRVYVHLNIPNLGYS